MYMQQLLNKGTRTRRARYCKSEFKRFLLGFKIFKVNYEIIFIIQNSKSLFLQEYSRNLNIFQTISI